MAQGSTACGQLPSGLSRCWCFSSPLLPRRRRRRAQVPLALDSEHGQLLRAMQVQCGAAHTLVLVQNRGRLEVRSSGDSSYGQSGLGDRTERHRFHPLPRLQVS